MNRWQAIVFDLDDTLYPERDYALSGFRAVAHWADSRLGIPAGQGYAELRRMFEQGVRGDTFNRWLAAHGVPADGWIEELVQVYRTHIPVLTPFPEVPALLAALRPHYRIGLVSDGYLDVQRQKFAALRLADYFDAVVFSDEWGREAWKPSIFPFVRVAQMLRVEPRRAMYVADNPTKDFLGARRAGLTTVWCRRAHGEYTHLEPPTDEHEPDWSIPSLAAFENILIRLENSA
ncbi:MAG: HAD family hydrolase [Chloroflexi bacterium]|nr:HAD family hydrolase [Chloroflexota bacterium]